MEAAAFQSSRSSSFYNVSCTSLSSHSVCFETANITTTSSICVSSSDCSPVTLISAITVTSTMSSSSSTSATSLLKSSLYSSLIRTAQKSVHENGTIAAVNATTDNHPGAQSAASSSEKGSSSHSSFPGKDSGISDQKLSTSSFSNATIIAHRTTITSSDASSVIVTTSSTSSGYAVPVLVTRSLTTSYSSSMSFPTSSPNLNKTKAAQNESLLNITSSTMSQSINTTDIRLPITQPTPLFVNSTLALLQNTTCNTSFPRTSSTALSVNTSSHKIAPHVHLAMATATPKPKAVFAHYLVGTVSAAHAAQDIDEAMAMGLDGFALNIGDPFAEFLAVSLDNIFGYAEYRGFKLFFSLDTYAAGNSCYSGRSGACRGPLAYEALMKYRLVSPSWYLGPNGFPLLSTYSSGGKQDDTWEQWKQDFAQRMFFIPNFDETSGYYTADPGWYAYWGGMVDGTFSWESAWPIRSGKGGRFPGDISPDLVVQKEMTQYNKSYMIPLSTLQYKNSYGANVYRAGDLNLPVRMESILEMESPPDFIEIISWNDGPEGHYIGNLWLEQNNDTAPMRYANQIQFPHHPWQALLTSFLVTYKNGGKAIDMAPVDGSSLAVGAIWYKTILTSSTCPGAPNANLYNATRPDGFDTATDTLSYAVVISPEAPSYTLRAISNGKITIISNLHQGLNYGSVDVQAGYQRMELVDSGNNIVLAATGGRCISAGCPDCLYNMNPQVIAFLPDTGDLGTCPYQACQKQVFAHYMVRFFHKYCPELTYLYRLGQSHQNMPEKISMMLLVWALMDLPLMLAIRHSHLYEMPLIVCLIILGTIIQTLNSLLV